MNVDAGDSKVLAAPCLDAGKIKQFVDDRYHQFGLPEYCAQQILSFGFVKLLGKQEFGETVDACHRRAQFVRRMGEKFALHAVYFGFTGDVPEVEDIRDAFSR